MTRGVHLEDLPAAVRRQLQVTGQVTVSNSKQRRVARGHTTWRCHSCGCETSVWAQAERHAWGERHYRIEIVL